MKIEPAEPRVGLALRLAWGDQFLAAQFLDPALRTPFTIGSSRHVGISTPEGSAWGGSFELLQRDVDDVVLILPTGVAGELFRGGSTYPLASSSTLQSADLVRIQLDALTLDIRFRPSPRRVISHVRDSFDLEFVNTLLAVFALFAAWVVASWNQQAEGEPLESEWTKSATQFAKYIAVEPPKAKGVTREIDRLGCRGTCGASESTTRSTARRLASARDLVRRALSGGGGIDRLLGGGGFDELLRGATGRLVGPASASTGLSAWGLRGTRDGAGDGQPTEGMKIGALGTRGWRRGGDTYGERAGRLEAKQSIEAQIEPTDLEINGGLDRELIREVIHRNRGQIRYCYEEQLTRAPDLHGKIAVKFIISSSGLVASSEVAQSTVGDETLSRCVVSRVRAWVFPKPKNGGISVVTYPFVFKQSGQ